MYKYQIDEAMNPPCFLALIKCRVDHVLTFQFEKHITLGIMSSHDAIPIVDDGGAFYGVPPPNINAGIPRPGQAFVPQIPVPQQPAGFQPGYGQPQPFAVPGQGQQVRAWVSLSENDGTNFST